MKRRNIKLIIEYDGTNFSGWQIQPHPRTVQEVLQDAIHNVTGEEVALNGSGRTDAGVHAYGQTANFHTDTKLETDALKRAINANLPDDVVVKVVEEAPEDFHARFSAKSKTYLYAIKRGHVRPVIERRTALYVAYDLDLSSMMEAADLFMGEHDFSAFAIKTEDDKDCVRLIEAIEIDDKDEYIFIRITGNGFLRKMVRSIVGTLLEVGRGKLKIDDVKNAIDKQDKTVVGATAASHGLCLLEVKY